MTYNVNKILIKIKHILFIIFVYQGELLDLTNSNLTFLYAKMEF